jgi:hypothetical protein
MPPPGVTTTSAVVLDSGSLIPMTSVAQAVENFVHREDGAAVDGALDGRADAVAFVEAGFGNVVHQVFPSLLGKRLVPTS